ncbi:MAG: hypothetical protein VCB25_12365 [Myxococcota bacterium]
MKIGSAAVAGVAEADGLAGSQGNLALTRLTLHAASVLQNRR